MKTKEEERLSQQGSSYVRRKHVWYRCPRGKHDHEDVPQHCVYCDGGLASCTVCNGAEATLTTECPGRPMHQASADLVQSGRLDYVGGKWRTR